MLWAMCDAAGALDEDDPEFDADSQEFDWVMEVLCKSLCTKIALGRQP